MMKYFRWIVAVCSISTAAGALVVQGDATLTQAVWQNYRWEIELAGVAVFALVIAMLAYFWRSNRLLRELTILNRETQISLELTAAVFDSQVGLIVANESGCIQRANPAMTRMLGYEDTDLDGQSTRTLRGIGQLTGTMRAVLKEVTSAGRWKGELLCRHHDGQDVPCMVTINTVHNRTIGLSGFVGSFIDISGQQQAQDEIWQLAYFDPLTQLPNRRMFMESLRNTMRETLRNGHLAGLIFIDLDHFKNLNDAHGHTVGDQLLCRAAERLRQLMDNANGLTARLGGDEFVVMLSSLDTSEDLALAQTLIKAEQIHQALRQPFELETHTSIGLPAMTLRYTCSGSIGVALFGMLDEPLTEVLKRADLAMYKSKQDGRNLIRCYDPAAQRALAERMALSNDLNIALHDGQLKLLYQVQVDAQNQAVGAECLLRWYHPVRGLVSPVEFIPLAEESGAIVAIGDWVMQRACDLLVSWESDSKLKHLTLSVNVSPRQFTETDFVDRVARMLSRTGAKPQLLCLEVTEGIVLQDTQEVIGKMRDLCNMGLSFSIDDFGTGYSSLSYLQSLPLAEIKIDKSFINDMATGDRTEAIVKAIVSLGHSMGITIVAEGVETQMQKDYLLTLGCTLLQGYLISHPVDSTALETLVLAHHSAAIQKSLLV
jgi:diguanylate cyclase (GGDEF)-like protein/PAS domain S-box-containing protein